MNRRNNLLLIFLVVPLGIALLILFNNEESDTTSREIVALVNGQPIYLDNVDKEVATLTPEQRESVSVLDVVDFLVEKILLLQAAQKEGIKVTREEVDQLRRIEVGPFVYRTPGIIAKQNLTEEDLLKRLTEQAVINKLLAAQEKNLAIIKNAEVRSVYESSYDKNVSFEDVESEIVLSLLDKKRANIRTSYINSLKVDADIDVFI